MTELPTKYSVQYEQQMDLKQFYNYIATTCKRETNNPNVIIGHSFGPNKKISPELLKQIVPLTPFWLYLVGLIFVVLWLVAKVYQNAPD